MMSHCRIWRWCPLWPPPTWAWSVVASDDGRRVLPRSHTPVMEGDWHARQTVYGSLPGLVLDDRRSSVQAGLTLASELATILIWLAALLPSPAGSRCRSQ